jgi:hypothetical protein
METINTNLSFIDDINFKCSKHTEIFIGVCGDIFCKEKSLICNKCIKNNETCITQKSHELITLAELFYMYFTSKKGNYKKINYEYINSLINQIKDIDYSLILKELKQIKNSSLEKIDQTLNGLRNEFDNHFKKIINYSEDNFENISFSNLPNNNNNINNLNEYSLSANTFLKELRSFLNEKISHKILDEEFDIENFIKKIDNKNNNFNNYDEIKKENENDLIEKNEIFDYLNKLNSLKIQKNSQLIIKYNKIEEFLDNFSFEKFEKNLDDKFENMEKLFCKEIILIDESFKLKIEKEKFTFVSNSIEKFKNNPESFIYITDICQNSHTSNSIDSTFCVFRTLSGKSYVAWGTGTVNGFKIEIYDLSLQKIIKTIDTNFNELIYCCRHFLDRNNKKDYLISSSYDKSIKVFSINENYKNILTIKNVCNTTYLYSVLILSEKHEKKNYIISSCPCEEMRVFSFTGEPLRSFGSKSESTYFIDVFYYDKLEKYFILNANSADVKSYDFATGKLYKQYKSTPSNWHMSIIINQLPDICQLIESDGGGHISIWDFDLGVLLKKIKAGGSSANINLRGICLWNDKYLLSAASDFSIKLFNLEKSEYVMEFKNHTKIACSVKKILDPNYGECFISHGLDGRLILWGIKNY